MTKQLVENLVKIVLVAAVLIFVVVLLVKRFLYFRPKSKFLPVQEEYRVIQQRHLYGWFLDSPNPNSKVILFCHGNAGNISYYESKIYPLRDLGYNVLIFDYSGYGKSGGVPSEQQCYDDASAMVALLRQTYSPDHIVLYGHSLGGPIATYVARRYSIPTLVLESPLTSIKALIKARYPMFSIFTFMFPEFDTSIYLNGYRGRSLLMHSPEDEMIPYANAEQLQKLTTYHIPITGSHNNTQIPWEEVKKFIDSN